jgi:hypothetical protein
MNTHATRPNGHNQRRRQPFENCRFHNAISFEKVFWKKRKDIFGCEKAQRAVGSPLCGIGYRYVLKLREVSLRRLFRVFFG